jgi:hypothetical protein
MTAHKGVPEVVTQVVPLLVRVAPVVVREVVAAAETHATESAEMIARPDARGPATGGAPTTARGPVQKLALGHVQILVPTIAPVDAREAVGQLVTAAVTELAIRDAITLAKGAAIKRVLPTVPTIAPVDAREAVG